MEEDPTLHLPRILCLHGGGTNAKIFQAQCRKLSASLESDFRFIFAQAPFESQAGPDVSSVYSLWGPFKRWLRWKPEQPYIGHEEALAKIDESILTAIRADDDRAATGEVVAVLGFSQGAKLAASLLYRQQVRTEKLGRRHAGSNYRFGILLAGRAPLVDLNPTGSLEPGIPDTSQTTDDKTWPDQLGRHMLTIPTIHVHGLRDKGLRLHRQLLDDYCAPRSTRLLEWDGDHRVPIKYRDVMLVCEEILDLALLTGARS